MTVRASAPGRVNLIGEHTDYNNGFVLPIATPQRTEVRLERRGDLMAKAVSVNVPDAERTVEFAIGSETRTGSWGDYVAGVTWALRERGVRLCGFEVLISSSLPLGGGLGSSASLEVALLRALDQAFSLSLDPVAIARIAHRAETGLVGAPVGIMDQMAASLADSDEALFLDTMTLAFARVPFPRPAGLIVIHSGVAHRHAEGEYRTRRRECEEAAQRLGVDTLRDISLAEFRPERLPPPLDRRGRHVVAENERVVRAREALQAGDLVLLGRLMNESHQSMRDDFEVSTPEIDSLVGIAQAEEGVFGARLTGGGFGGSIVAVTSADAARRRAQRIADAYAKRAHVQPQILIPDLSAGA